MPYSNFQKTIALSVGVLSMAFLIGYIVLAWTEPTSNPPGENVSPPLTACSQCNDEFVNVSGDKISGNLSIAGNVSIGTTTEPKAALHLNPANGKYLLIGNPFDTGSYTTGIVVQGPNDGKAGILIYPRDAANPRNPQAPSQGTALRHYNQSSGLGEIITTGNLVFSTNSGSLMEKPATSEQMRITTAGKVGIGIKTPTEKLQVAGNIKLGGNEGDIKGVDQIFGYNDLRLAGDNDFSGEADSGADLYINADGDVAITNGNLTVGGTINGVNMADVLTSESDPKIGTLTSDKWCTTDGSKINCTSDGPQTYTGTDPISVSGNTISLQYNSADFTLTAEGNLQFNSARFSGWDTDASDDLTTVTTWSGGDLTGTGVSPSLVESGVTEGTYTYPTITVDKKGRVTSAFSGIAPTNYWTLSDTDIYNNNSGNVGIGTPIPIRPLTVKGSGAQEDGGQVLITSDGSNGLFLAAASEESHYNWLIGEQFNTAKALEFTPSTLVGGTIFSKPAMVIKADTGNVGIGTTEPEGALHVTGSNAGAATIKGVSLGISEDKYASLELKGTSQGGGFIDFGYPGDDYQGRIIYTNNNNKMKFYTSKELRMTINETGNVGIGTLKPTFVNDDQGGLHIGPDVPGGQAALRLDNANGKLAQLNRWEDRFEFLSSDAFGWAVGSVGSTKMILDSDGNVGIGTTEPNYKLDVNGNIGLTGTHLVFNSGHGVIDWGNGSGGNLYFRTLEIQGNITKYNNRVIIENNGNITVGNDGTGKINVGEIDPVFDIDGEKYSTYVPDIAGGLTTQTFGKANLSFNQESGKYEYIICFDALEKGSDLWLFGKTTDFGKEMENLTVLLTPEKETANLYYQLDPKENQLIIFGEKPVTFSYFLSAPRIDHKKHLDNLAEDQDLGGIKVSDYRE